MKKKDKLLIKFLSGLLFYISLIDIKDNNIKFYEVRDLLNDLIVELDK